MTLRKKSLAAKRLAAYLGYLGHISIFFYAKE
jgi:hypothetical protein